MANPFGRAKKIYNLKKRAGRLKRRMEGVVVEVEERGVRIVMRGDQRVKEVFVDGEKSDRLKSAFNKAVKESQKKVAKKVGGDLSDLGL